MKIIHSYKTIAATHYTVWLDETKTINDPSILPPDDEEELKSFTHPQIPDPTFLRQFQWGNDVKESAQIREMELLCNTELSVTIDEPIELAYKDKTFAQAKALATGK